MIVADIMTREVVTVSPETDLSEIVSLMISHNISGVPVVQDGEVVGVISEGDLLRRSELHTEAQRPRWLEMFTSDTVLAGEYARSHARRAELIMARDVVTIADDRPLAELAALMEQRRIKRVPVLRDGKLVGIVSRSNLVRALASHLAPLAVTDRTDDRALHDAIEAELRRQSWAPLLIQCSIVVEDGVVHLWGRMRSDEDRKAVIAAAENVAGVKKVVDHTARGSTVLL